MNFLEKIYQIFSERLFDMIQTGLYVKLPHLLLLIEVWEFALFFMMLMYISSIGRVEFM